jgi:two-component system phosphate regulon sensor histidine kinase PhoR
VKVGVRGRIFLVSFALVLGVLVVSGGYLEHALSGWIEERIAGELTRQAALARDLIETAPDARTVAAADALADRMGRDVAARVTITNADGRVLGDSDEPVEKVPAMENHGGRPEIVQALAEGRGIARRHSHTLGVDMLYVAVPYRRADGSGAVRVALPLTQVDRTVRRLRLFLAAVGLAAAVLAAATAGVASRYLTRTLGRLIERAQALTGPTAADTAAGDFTASVRRMAAELERTVEALAAERDRVETILESMDDAVLSLDGERRITRINRAALILFGLNADPTGRPLLDVVRVPALHDLIAGAGPGGTGGAEFEAGPEVRRRVLARVTSLRSGRGLVVVVHDVTELRRLETVRRDFVANASHELRTPVAVIRATAETLRDGALDDPERARGFLDALDRHADRLARLVADLLDVSMIEAGRYPLSPRAVEVEPAARRVAALLDRMIRAKALTVEIAVPPRLRVEADAEALEHVLLNLVDNAVKYTPAGGRVTISAEPARGGARIAVTDDGPGIEPQHRGRLFERFYRVDPGRSREMGGTGLGLAIVRHLVGAMGGEAGMDPVSPHGASFWFILPAPEARGDERRRPVPA